MSKHTPGPWRAIGNRIMTHRSSDYISQLYSRHVPGGPSASEEEKANAKLIAAAPEMLEALKKLWACAGEFEASLAAALDQAADAIVKAEGVE